MEVTRQSTVRMPYEGFMPAQPHWEKQIENPNFKHFSLVIGPTQHGKDTFISSLDPNIKNNSCVKIGDGTQSCSEKFDFIEYKNEKLIGKNQGTILNTIGIGQSNNRLLDDEIVEEIYGELIQNSKSFIEGIHVFYFVQSLNDSPITLIERSLIQMQAALGKEIFASSVIIATKGNKIHDPDELLDNLDILKKLAQKYGVRGGVIDYRCPYMIKVKNELKEKNPISEEGFIQMQSELRSCIQSLPYFRTNTLVDEYQQEIEKIQLDKKSSNGGIWNYKFDVQRWIGVSTFNQKDTSNDVEETKKIEGVDFSKRARQNILQYRMKEMKEKLKGK